MVDDSPKENNVTRIFLEIQCVCIEETIRNGFTKIKDQTHTEVPVSPPFSTLREKSYILDKQLCERVVSREEFMSSNKRIRFFCCGNFLEHVYYT